MRGKGSQKKARLERLKNEIVDYVTNTPGVSAADIVAFLSNERKMRNHGLTTRKVGLFIPLHLADMINFPFGRFNRQANLPRSRLSKHHLHATELHGVAMDWQSMTTAAALFPSFDGTEDGCLPTLPVRGPVWTLLNPNEETGLKAQMSALSGAIDVDNQGFFVRGEGIIIDASATVEAGAYLIGPCYIGPRAVVRSGAYVREYSWICADAVVGHATEVKHSILLPGAKAPHFNYVGDSILGKDVNLGAGTKLSNLRNDGGEVHLRVSGERVASGLRKFGALLGEGVALGCNSVTNPGVILGCDSVVWPNVTVTGVHGAKSEHR